MQMQPLPGAGLNPCRKWSMRAVAKLELRRITPCTV